MITLHPQLIKDTNGKNLVVLPEKEFEELLDEIEEIEDIRLYNKFKEEDTGERILFSDYLKKKKEKNG